MCYKYKNENMYNENIYIFSLNLFNEKKIKSQYCAIFSRDSSLNIFAAITFHDHVRNGMVWFYYAINTEIEIIC